MTAAPPADILALLDGVRPAGSGKWMARCPAHADRTPSLSIAFGADGRVLLRCQAGCPTADVCTSLGIEMKDLFPPRERGVGHGRNGRARNASAGRVVETYDYTDRDGVLLFQVRRMEPKGFRQRRPDGRGGWIPNLEGVQRVLYRFPDVMDADREAWVFVTEGEKDCDRLWREGLVATTNAGGAGKWRPEYTACLRSRRVCMLPDNDPAGAQHADAVAGALRGVASEVRVVALPNLPAKGDVSDFLNAGGTAEQLVAFAGRAPQWSAPNQVERARGSPAAEPESGRESDEAELTDVGNGQRLIKRHGHKLRYCARFGRWLAWTGQRSQLDEAGEVDRMAVETIQHMKQTACGMGDKQAATALFKHALRSEANRKVKDMIERASKEAGVFVSPDELDRDPWRFNVENGTLDLRAGELRPHLQSDLITKLAPVRYDPAATCPVFLAFLDRIFEGNENLIRFVQRFVGYALTGNTSERCLFILWGSGANGKSTLLAVLRHLLGDYAIQLPSSALLAKKNDTIPNDIARLKGARFVSAVETDEGRRLAESLIKQLTGGEDELTARFMRGEWFDFKPEFKLFLATNHKPEIRGTDDAIWDRVKLIPFNVRIPPEARDRDLAEKLKAESAGILAWAVRGCTLWQREGLGTPSEVRAATAGYRQEMEKLGEFIVDECVLGDDLCAGATPLYERYKIWCQLRGEVPMNQTLFGRKLGDRGHVSSPDSTTGRTLRRGIGIRVSEPPEGF